jgi:hypothetical protein
MTGTGDGQIDDSEAKGLGEEDPPFCAHSTAMEKSTGMPHSCKKHLCNTLPY